MSSDTYQVDKIVGYKVLKGTQYYKVHWAGYNSRHDSWEPVTNLTSCPDLIQDYHKLSKTKKRLTRRSMATTTPTVPTIEFSSGEEDVPMTLRRSQRARTPTRYFHSEMPRHRRRTPTPQPRDIPSEPGEEERKESSHLRVPEKEPEKKNMVSETVEGPTPYALRSVSAKDPTAPSAALSSDEESAGIGGSELDPTGVTPRISLYESKVRKRLNELSEMTKKSLSETISAKSKAAQQKQQPSDKDVQSTRSFEPSPPMTRSRTLRARQSLTVQPSTTYTRTKLRSGREQQEEKKKEKEESKRKRTEKDEEKERDVEAEVEQGKVREEGGEDDSATDEHPSTAHPQDLSTQEPPQVTMADQEQVEPYPQWMQLGWEEVTFALVILALMIFSYYCFYSESC